MPQYRVIVDSLKLLSASLEEQRRYLPDFADIPDDVTSSFENAFSLMPQLVEANKFSNNSIAAVLRVYNYMQWCLRNVDLDDFDGPEWDKLRELAGVALISLNETLDMPAPGWA